jgi:hypothetical protein
VSPLECRARPAARLRVELFRRLDCSHRGILVVVRMGEPLKPKRVRNRFKLELQLFIASIGFKIAALQFSASKIVPL